MLTIELSRTLIAHASVTTLNQREELWKEAERLLVEFESAEPNNPRSIEVAAELAMIPARIAELLAWTFEIHPADVQSRTAAEARFRQALDRLRSVSARIEKSPPPKDSDLADGALTSSELAELQQKIQYTIAVSQHFMATVQAAGPNRAGGILETREQLERLIRSRPEGVWTFRARLFRARMDRLQGDFARAESQLRSMLRDADDEELQDQVLAEWVRTRFDAGQLDEGFELISQRTQKTRLLSDELRALAVEGLLAAWRIAGEKNDPALQADLLEQAKSHHQRTRGRWHQLTEARLRQVQQNLNLGDELAELVRSAQFAYQQGDLLTATKEYSQAAATAHRQQKPDLAVDYAFTKGAIEVQQQDWPAAAQTFLQISQTYPDHPRAADAGLMHAYSLGQVYLSQPTRESREAYEQALQTQLRNFPDSPSASEATWMLAVHQEQRLQWTDAVELYRKIPPGSPRFDAASLRIVVLYEKILTRLREIDGPVQQWEDRLLEDIVRIEDQLPANDVLKSLEQCHFAVRTAQLLLQHRDRWYAVADHWLRRIERAVEYQFREAELRGESLNREWKQVERAAAQLRIVSLAGQQRLGEARAIMLKLEQTSPEAMLGILLGLTEMTSKIDTRLQVELGYLQLEAINRLAEARDQLSTDQQSLLDDCRAEAQIAVGNLFEASEIYEELLERFPADERLMRKVIDVSIRRGRAEDLLRARKWWTQIEQLHDPGTPDWISARLNIARLNVRLGKPAEARKLLGVTKALYPTLGTPELKAEFEATLLELEESP